MNIKLINIIVAMNQDNVIGVNNQLPWHIPEDLKYFKELTTSKVIIMGRKTYESIGHALPKRINVVISRNKTFIANNVIAKASISEAIESFKDQEIFIIGGGEIFSQALPIANKLYVTLVDLKVNNPDSFFPLIMEHEWQLINEKKIITVNNILCKFQEYIRRSK